MSKTTDTRNVEVPRNEPRKGMVCLPLGGGWSEREKKDLEREFGGNWRDLFNGL